MTTRRLRVTRRVAARAVFVSALLVGAGGGIAWGTGGGTSSIPGKGGDDAHLEGHTPTTLVTLDLPAGSYALSGRANLQNLDNDPWNVECGLSTSTSTSTGTGSYDQFAGGFLTTQTIQVHDLVTLTSPGLVSLWCAMHDGDGLAPQLTAIKVGALH